MTKSNLSAIADQLPRAWNSTIVGQAAAPNVKVLRMDAAAYPDESHDFDEALLVLDGCIAPGPARAGHRGECGKKFILTLLIFLTAFPLVQAQNSTTKHKIAIFAPLYLDSAFNELDEYRYAKNAFPKFINPGLEFYEGAQLALDSLNKEYAQLEVFVYDTRSAKESLTEQLNKPEMDSMALIIAHCNTSEVKQFADAGLKRNIPVINANLPNDGGTNGNRFFVLLNPTLRTQCEGIYRHIQKYYSLNPIIVFRKKGQLEDRVKLYFDEFGKNTVGVPLKMKYVDLTDSFTVNHLKPYLDTTNQTLCVAGSLDENFGIRLTQQLAYLKKQKYLSSVVGMPTWDNIKRFQ